jgi:hypothetical protein
VNCAASCSAADRRSCNSSGNAEPKADRRYLPFRISAHRRKANRYRRHDDRARKYRAKQSIAM